MATSGDRPALAGGGLNQIPDIDPQETGEWLESLDGLLSQRGEYRTRYILRQLVDRARERQVSLPALAGTDYINTIPPEAEPEFPGDPEVERRLSAAIRWNAAVTVSKANRKGLEVGGHIATFQSASVLYEIGFNHFFRGKQHPGGGDQVFFQGHASPGMYARAFLEGRLSAELLDNFRQEASRGPGQGLSSYPHPRSMPHFWEYPTVSMGITATNSIYQARFNKYLGNRGIKDTSQQRVWAFLGDGEMGEVESIGALGVAGREQLDNLTWVVNCNLQQLDGPVRGNGKIVQELESIFVGAGWNVIKLLWGHDWDPLLAADRDGSLVNKLNATPDGQFQTYIVEDGAYIRDHLFDTPTLQALVSNLSDEQVHSLSRGGHDYRKVYAAYQAATAHTGQPTAILVQTIKGWGINALEARNATHQMKKLNSEDLKAFRDRLELPIPDDQLEDAYHPPYYHPGEDSAEIRYLHERRQALGGYLPERKPQPKVLTLPGDAAYQPLMAPASAKVATTQAFVRLLRDLMRDPSIGKRIVPIAPDEFRTFGMDSMFPTAKIYSPFGQRYESVDRKLLLAYKEATDGQLLHEGISEAGAMASTTAAGSSYATHGEPMIPFYIFYSMFGFQRTGDFMWAMADQLSRGFLLGATAGRTTLTGEGLQHADGHSPLLASTNTAVVHYDPAFAYEVAFIVKDGLRRMYGFDNPEHPGGENLIYYITMYNEPVDQPGAPEHLDVSALLKGMYHYASAPAGDDARPKSQILASGVAMPAAVKAQQILNDEWGVAADVWSVTSWNELRRDGIEAEHHRLAHPDDQPRVPFVTEQLRDTTGPVVAVSDYMRAVQDQISRWVPNRWSSLGADGFGFADTRAGARRFFMIDAESIVVATLQSLADEGQYDPAAAAHAFKKYELGDPTAVAHVQQEGAGA